MPSLLERLQHGWNAFNNKDPTPYSSNIYYGGSYINQSRRRLSVGNERSIVNAIYNRIAADVAAVDIRHVRLDENGRYTETIDDNLNKCLSIEANIAVNTVKAYAPGLGKAADVIDRYGTTAITALSVAYSAKKMVDNRNLRVYNTMRSRGTDTIKYTGSQEYKDVVERRKRGG